MRGQSGEPLAVWRLLFRTLVVPCFVVAVLVGGTMATLRTVQGPPRQVSPTSSALAPARGPVREVPPGHSTVTTTPARHGTASPPARAKATPTPTPTLGAYVGPGAPAAAAALSARLPGGIDGSVDYLDDRSWATIASPSWAVGRWAAAGEPMTYFVPMLPADGGSLAQGAAGAYDAEFRRLAGVLVDNGQASATLVLGWSPLRPGLPWSVRTPQEAAAYVAYFRRIVTAMRAERGARFVFAYDPVPVPPDATAPGPGTCYPGNRYVSEVAIQVSDQLIGEVAPSKRWAEIRALPFGPAWSARFAERLGRPLVVDGLELSPAALGGAGDDWRFVAGFFTWARAVHVASVVLWATGDAALSPAADPRAFAVVRSLAASGAVGTSGARTGRAAGRRGTPPA